MVNLKVVNCSKEKRVKEEREGNRDTNKEDAQKYCWQLRSKYKGSKKGKQREKQEEMERRKSRKSNFRTETKKKYSEPWLIRAFNVHSSS